MAKEVYIKNRERRNGQQQFFMHQFVEAAIKSGIPAKKEYSLTFIYRLWRKILQFLFKSGFFPKNNKTIIITSRGEDLLASAAPYYGWRVVPMLWDVWPETWDRLYKEIKLLGCQKVMVTVNSMAEKLHRDLGIETLWVPEGINVNDYLPGDKLSQRHIQVYELGRQHPKYHSIIMEQCKNGVIKEYIGNTINKDGSTHYAFATAKDLIDTLHKIQIIISFPRTDTNPNMAGGLETLTQRYWEAILSKCLIVGRAPKELIDLIGYNPVVDVDWKNPKEQIENIINNIGEYQLLVDKNYQIAQKYASWDSRINIIIDWINS